jgi:hypothetical protein
METRCGLGVRMTVPSSALFIDCLAPCRPGTRRKSLLSATAARLPDTLGGYESSAVDDKPGQSKCYSGGTRWSGHMRIMFRCSRACGVVALLAGIASVEALAQAPRPMPTTTTIDKNGVDLINWSYSYEITSVKLGDVNLSIYYPSDRDNFYADLRIEDPSGLNFTRATATAGGKTWVFITNGSVQDPGTQLVPDMYSLSTG